MSRLFLMILFSLFGATVAFGHGDAPAGRADIVLEERLGQFISPDAVFADENGRTTSLKDLHDVPLLIVPVYLGCTHTCPLLLTGVAQALGKLERVKPVRDYRVIALSIDEQDTPQIALAKKKNYVKAVGGGFPAEAWTFLTGDASNIKKFTDSIGFTFQRDGKDFSHPVTLVVISPQGKIVRYLDGVSFLPFDLAMAVQEAAEGRVMSAGRRVMMYCFSYDPLKKSYVFNILKVVGTAVAVFVVSFFAYLIGTSRKKRGTE